ncbi:hypothetical protein D9611_008133 [Ephemerocybe angulata]|uniref:Uncharacterized protein n=1 Tax=Ephemerocybe angulata TaxID=980116 RepID=A0A8H5C1B5_9AGAR|nr:hypothetical protein D9611_008133 [Tulosesus angulatus]
MVIWCINLSNPGRQRCFLQLDEGGQLSTGKRLPSVLVVVPGSIWKGPLNLHEEPSAILEHINAWRAKIEKADSILLVGGGAVGITYGSTSSPSFSASGSGYELPHVRELSCELADSIEMFVQMVLQISPAHVVHVGHVHCHEEHQLSVCQTPQQHDLVLWRSFGEDVFGTRLPGRPDGSLPPLPIFPGLEQIVFDIGETLQAVGDSLSRCAAQAGCCTTGM